MKVKELIEQLQEADPEAEVIYGHSCYTLSGVDGCRRYVSLRSYDEDYEGVTDYRIVE